MPTFGNTPADTPGDFKRLIPRKEYAKELGVSVRTVSRYEQIDPDFPPVIYRCGMATVTDTSLENYKKVLIQRSLSGKSAPANPYKLAQKTA